MTEATRGRSSDSSRYEIRIGGRLAPRWATWFDGMTLTTAGTGRTRRFGVRAAGSAVDVRRRPQAR